MSGVGVLVMAISDAFSLCCWKAAKKKVLLRPSYSFGI